MAKRYLEFKDAKSNKFWEVSVTGKVVNIRYGKLGTDGQSSIKVLSTPAEAESHAEKQAAGKLKKGYKEAKAKAVTKKVAKKVVKKKMMIDLKGPDGKIKIRLTHDAYSFYDDEDENITEVLETFYEGKIGDTWQDVAQEAADFWDWDDEAVINFEAKSELSETSRDHKKMEFLNSKGKWQDVPEEVENWYYEAQDKAMGI